jgi:uncharacterized protein YqhQ
MSDSRTEQTAPDGEERLRLGGMALRNGILVHSLHHWAAAIRHDDGRIEVASGKKPEVPDWLTAAPLLRGVVRIAEAMAILPVVRTRLPGARLPMEGPGTSAAIAASSLAAVAVRRSSALPAWVTESLVAGIGLVPALVVLRGSQTAAYHGAEHKTIGGYETGDDALDATKEHDRCGSHLVGPLIAASVAGNVLVRRLPEQHRGPARLASSLAAVGVAVETFGWMGRHKDHPLSRALRVPGHELQRRAGTREPSSAELEVAERALDELLKLERV